MYNNLRRAALRGVGFQRAGGDMVCLAAPRIVATRCGKTRVMSGVKEFELIELFVRSRATNTAEMTSIHVESRLQTAGAVPFDNVCPFHGTRLDATGLALERVWLHSPLLKGAH